MDADLSSYKVVTAPMLYMVRPGVGEAIETFVRNGGTFVTTYWSGIADENDLCFFGGRPGPLRSVLGIWSEELDVLYDDESASVRCEDGNALGIAGDCEGIVFCDLVHLEGAEALANYGSQFYAGRPALTVNRLGEGSAYYIAFRSVDKFLDMFYDRITETAGVRRLITGDPQAGVTAQVRSDGTREFIFLLNFTGGAKSVTLTGGPLKDLLDGSAADGPVDLAAHGSRVLERAQESGA
jgi:beta-galactosidase